MARRKHRVSKAELAQAVRKHFNALAVNEAEAVVNTLYVARTTGEFFCLDCVGGWCANDVYREGFEDEVCYWEDGGDEDVVGQRCIHFLLGIQRWAFGGYFYSVDMGYHLLDVGQSC